MLTRIAQKCCKALFPLWSIKKKRYIEINKIKSYAEKALLKALKRLLILKQIKR